eukprot:3458-Heterococcus_DN1.PRE.2
MQNTKSVTHVLCSHCGTRRIAAIYSSLCATVDFYLICRSAMRQLVIESECTVAAVWQAVA